MTVDKFTPPHPLNTAVLFLVFNRLDTTKQVFEAIREAKPPRLYVAADGARENKEGEDKKVQEVREYIMKNIDWECEVKTLFRESNLGCKMAVSGAIDWFFENEEMGIILEDDCLPSQSFFWFCEELLERYKDDMRIWHIGGYLHVIDDSSFVEYEQHYFFSKYTNIWAWATWSNRWKEYELDLKSFKYLKQRIDVKEIIFTNSESSNMRLLNNLSHIEKGMNTWDHQWWFTVLYNNGLVVKPMINLVKNIGIGHPDATHTSNIQSNIDIANELIFPLKHPKKKIINYIYDYYFIQKYMLKQNILIRILRKIKNAF